MVGKYMKKILTLLLIIIVLGIHPKNLFADYFVPQGIGQVVSQLVLNKQVKNPQNGLFVENLTVTDAHFLPGQEVTFRIEVRNAGGNELKGINVKDKLPDFVDFVSGPGKFDENSRTMDFLVDKLSPGESKTYEFIIKVRAQSNLPNNQLTCLTNLAQASIDQIFTQDTSVFCIENQVLGVTQEIPKTGPDNASLTLLASLLSLLMSVFLYRKSRKVRG